MNYLDAMVHRIGNKIASQCHPPRVGEIAVA